jgi:hypothetical protein
MTQDDRRRESVIGNSTLTARAASSVCLPHTHGRMSVQTCLAWAGLLSVPNQDRVSLSIRSRKLRGRMSVHTSST